MKKSSFHILRVGTAITFLWIGVLIFKRPEVWGMYLDPWVLDALPLSVNAVMIINAILNITIGFLLLTETWVHWAAIVAVAHMLIVLTVSGINNTTVRDIAILAGSLALFADSIPQATKENLMFWKKSKIQ